MTSLNIFCMLLLLSTSTAFAEDCPEDFTLSGEQDLASNYKATLCWKQTSSNTGELRSILNSPALKKPVTGSFAIENENQITKIAFAEQSLTLKKGQITLSVTIESRVHESEHDEDISDLWLLQFDGKTLSKVLAAQTQFSSWATQCESDCRDTEHIATMLLLGTPQANGFSNIRLQKTETTIPYDQPESKGSSQKRIEEYQFNGREYLAL